MPRKALQLTSSDNILCVQRALKKRLHLCLSTSLSQQEVEEMADKLFDSCDDRSRGDVGYAIAVEYWGQGIATNAVKMTIPQVYNDFPEIVRPQALADVENKASQRVLVKAGFIKEGILRKYGYHKGKIVDLVMYSLLSTESDI
ncbi:uncharacterized protein LOC107824832 [Nicotiana tabacum]|uniref:Uncharacterized protein LOC107824832 n=1 Tax=Nicotiana tabacum TaxID=4097 RepID=A0AC58TDU2_TOBAC